MNEATFVNALKQIYSEGIHPSQYGELYRIIHLSEALEASRTASPSPAAAAAAAPIPEPVSTPVPKPASGPEELRGTILELLEAASAPLSAGDVSKRLGVSYQRAYIYLQTLVHRGKVERVEGEITPLGNMSIAYRLVEVKKALPVPPSLRPASEPAPLPIPSYVIHNS